MFGCIESLRVVSSTTTRVILISVCLSAPCPAPVPPANGFVFGESHQHHGIIQFFCKGGFTLRGSSFSECVDGKWNTPKPSCEGDKNM